MSLHDPDARLLDRLRQRLAAGNLPGEAAQRTMMPPLRGEYARPPAGARHAAVMALLYPIDGRLHLLYIQRTSPKRDRHAGQISFPGGSVDPTDVDTEDTALRELEEEVGVARDDIEVLGALTPLYIPISNFVVDVYVGYTPARPTLLPQVSEVARTLELPLADFFAADAVRTGERKTVNGLTLKDIPYWAVRGEQIWGATSMMTAELVRLSGG